MPRAAIRFLRRTLEGWSHGAGLARADRLTTGNRVAIRERENGDYDAAEKTYQLLIEAGTKVHGPEGRELLWYRNDLAIVLSARATMRARKR
jgi:hypothetical protein